MFRKTISLFLCIGLIFAAVGCAASGNSSTAEEVKDAADTAAQDNETAETTAQEQKTPSFDKTEGASVAGAGTAGTAISALGAAPDTSVTDAAESGTDAYDASYAYVNVKYDNNNIIIIPNGTVNDDTVLYNGKTLGALCDYIDNEVLEEGRTINRNFLYGLVSVQVVDPQLMSSYAQLSRALIYCLTIANEFHSTDVTLTNLVIDQTNNTIQVFNVIAEGKEDAWILDGHENKFYLNGGNTEYVSTMFDAETMAIWSVVLDTFFEVQEP